jgi:hypothetical protein
MCDFDYTPHTPDVICCDDIPDTPPIILDDIITYKRSRCVSFSDDDDDDEQQPARKRLRKISEIANYSDSNIEPVIHIDKLRNTCYNKTNIVEPDRIINDRPCSICIKFCNYYTVVPHCFRGKPSSRQQKGPKIQLSNLGNTILICFSCITQCFISNIKNTNRLILKNPRLVFSLSGTRITNYHKRYDHPSIIRSLIHNRERFIVLERNTMDYFMINKKINTITCLHCRKIKENHTRVLDTDFYVCNECKDKKYLEDEYINIGGNRLKILVDDTLDIHKVSCDIHKNNKKYTMIKIFVTKNPAVMPICLSCFEDLYKSQIKLI